MVTAGKDDVARVAELCAGVEKTAQNAVDWLRHDSNRNVVGQRYDLLTRQMRQSARLARRLKLAATSPVSIAVYGASQAGKSFLVAHLAAPPAVADGERSAVVLPHARPGGISFLEINPTGGRESTGLVTRFTSRPVAGDAQFPVAIKLLTALDLVKILASCYFVDMEQSDEAPLDQKEIETLLANARTGGSSAGGLTGDDFYELRDYCRRWRHLRNNIEVLDAAEYWERIAAIVENVDEAELTRLVEPLWARIGRFTEIFRKLYGGLRSLGFAEDVRCGIDALMPRVDPSNPDKALTIIDVDTLKRLLGAGAEPLQVRHASGVATLDRPVVTALAAELILNVHGDKRAFLEQTDLLDFPGARSRGGTRRAKLDEKGEPEAIFLRGKVAHLFERYRDEFDLTSMILCVGPSAQEVSTLPTLINEWVEATHGSTPLQRQRVDTALFLVLTQFDRQFVRQAGEQTAMSDRWINRLNATISGFLARDGNWTREWQPGKPFNNVFWYRNPFVDQRHLFDYRMDGDRAVETALRADVSEYVGEMRRHYDDIDLIRRHFADPSAAWESVFKLNDGGISYLADAITIIARKNVKIGQIQARAATMAEQIRADLIQYYFDDDPTSQAAARVAKATQFLGEIEECYERGQFAQFLQLMQIRQDELAQIFQSVRLREGLIPEASAGPRGPGRLALQVVGGTRPDSNGSAGVLDCGLIAGKRLELEERFACRVLTRWSEQVDGVCQDRAILNVLGLTPEGAQTLASEMSAAIRRLNFARGLSDQTKEYVRFRETGADLGAWSPALMASMAVNGFVNSLGSASAEPPGGDRDLPLLSDEQAKFDEKFCVSWMRAFIDLVKANAESPDAKNFNVEQNGALDRILKDAAVYAQGA